MCYKNVGEGRIKDDTWAFVFILPLNSWKMMQFGKIGFEDEGKVSEEGWSNWCVSNWYLYFIVVVLRDWEYSWGYTIIHWKF